MKDSLALRGAIEDIDSAITNIEESVLAARNRKLATDTRDSTIQHALHDAYTFVESAIKKILDATGEPLPADNSCQDLELLERACGPVPGLRPAIFSIDTMERLDVLRTFRRVGMRDHAHFRFNSALPAIRAGQEILGPGGIRDEVRKFITAIDDGGHGDGMGNSESPSPVTK